MQKVIDRQGHRYGLLTVLQLEGSSKHGAKWLCLCDCGTTRVVRSDALVSGKTQSCGCRKRDLVRQRSVRHGHTDSPEYQCWKNLVQRCTNPCNPKYRIYGARGIRVDPRWISSFEAFFNDVGPRPSPRHSLDRRNNDGHYEPGNCYWATSAQQCRNRRISRLVTINGAVMTLSEAARAAGLTRETVASRIRYGWPEHLLFMPKGFSVRSDHKLNEAAASAAQEAA